MLESQNEVKKIVSSMIKYFDTQKQWDISKLLKNSYSTSEQIGYDNYNGGMNIYALIFELEIEDYTRYKAFIEAYSKEINEVADLFVRDTYREVIGDIRIVPICKQYIEWNDIAGKANKKEILDKIEKVKNIMILVATGGPKIQDMDEEYKTNYVILDEWFSLLKMVNPNIYGGLWEWYGRWKQDDLSTYASRRTFITEMYQGVIDVISKSDEKDTPQYELTGWDRVDRSLFEMKQRIVVATNEEQFQAIGMLGRETIITVAQQVYNSDIHKTQDGIEPSETDAKRMLEAFLCSELQGASNERTRKFAKAAVDMANHLTHDRTATKRDALMCLTSVNAVASLMKTIQNEK